MTVRGPEDGAGEEEVVVVLTADEVAFLANAVTESLEAVEEWEYETRLGGSRRTAQQLRRRLKASLRPDDGVRGGTSTREEFQAQVDEVVARAARLYPAEALYNVGRLVEHGEPVEGLCALGWVVVARGEPVPADLVDDIYRLTAELRRPGDLPDDLPSFRRPAGRRGSPVRGPTVRRHTVVLGQDSVVVEVDETGGPRSWQVGVVSAGGRRQLSVAGWRGICFGTGGGTAYAWTAREVLVLLGTGAPGPADATTSGRGVLRVDEDLVAVFRRAGRWVAVCETSVRVLEEDRVLNRVEVGDAVVSATWVGSGLELGLVDGGRLVVAVDG